MMLDTAHFDVDFRDRLVSSLTDLDGTLDGIVFHADNFHALSLAGSRFEGKVQATYIDPPYNTASSSIPYMNNYRHSSWASMMRASSLRMKK